MGKLLEELIKPIIYEIGSEKAEIIITEDFKHYLFAQMKENSIWFNAILPVEYNSPIFAAGHSPKILIAEALEHDKIVGTLRLKDKHIFVAPALVTSSRDDVKASTWYVMIQIPSDETSKPSRTIALRLAVITVMIMTLGLAFAYVVGSFTTRSIAQIANAAVRISLGELSARAKVSSKDEIGILAEQFNQRWT